MKNLMFFFQLVRTSIKASISMRYAFLIESFVMLLNNLVYFSLWFVFFNAFNEVAGWRIGDMMALGAVAFGSYGLMQIFFGGAKFISRNIVNGDLDLYMTQPKNLLINLLVSKSHPKGFGNVVCLIILTVFGGFVTLSNLWIIVLSVILGSLVFTANTVIIHSLVFWLGPMEGVANKFTDSLYLFSTNPPNIYSGFLQLVMFTLIPAGIIGYLPVELIREFTYLKFLGLVIGSIAFVSVAIFMFYSGLKRYESGNKFGVRV